MNQPVRNIISKKAAHAGLLLVLVTGCVSCSDLLNREPTARVETSSYYKTAEDARRAMNAVYAAARPQDFFDLYYQVVVGDIMSDNAAKGGGGASDLAEVQQLKLFTVKSDNSYVQNAWQFNFQGIYLANLVLEKVPPIEMNESQKSGILAEAHFFRAYYYLNLVRLFGNVPIVREPLEDGEYNIPQAGPSEIWQFIEDEIDAAIPDLSSASELSEEFKGRVTVGAAKSLLLNAYMWQQKWPEAEALADEIMNSGEYQLAGDYRDIWTTDGEFGSGSIFEINMATIPGKNLGSNVNLFEASRSEWGYGFVCPTQDLVDAFEEGDPRLNATVITDEEELSDGSIAVTRASPTGYYNQKYWLPDNQIPYNQGGGAGDGPTNERIYRLATVMLWGAEAAVHNGNIPYAANLVNQIRARARNSGGNTNMEVLPPYSTVTLENVYHEQRVEQALGMHRRFYNLVRTGRAESVLSNYQEGVNNYLPIPRRELQLSNGVLEQNPGYSN